MAASPETAEPPESSYTHPPSSPGLHPTQESPSLTTAAPPAMANPDYATQVPLPHAEQSTVERPEADEAPPTPIDEAEPSSSDPPPEAAPAASSAFEAIPTEKLTSPSPLPEGVAAEVSPEVAASAPSPSPSPQIVGPSPEDALPLLSPPRAPPSTTAHISTDPSTTESIAMASQEEAARPSPAPKLMDADSRTAPPPLTPTMESGLEGLLPQQQTRSPSPEMALTLYENLKRARPTPTQSCHPAECTDASPDAMLEGVVEGTLQVAGSLPVVEATDGDMAITPGVLPALENGSEGMLSQQQLQPPCPEIAPLQGENSKSAHPPRPPLPVESTYDCSNAALNEVSAVASEGASAALEYVAERSLQEPVQTPSTSRMEAEPCSPEMAPPGFEDFKSQWLPLSPLAPPAESTYNVVQVSATNPVGMMPDAATKSPSAIEAMDVKMDISPGLLPPLKSGAEGQSQQPLLRSCSPMMEDAPCSPDMPPPGFENCKSSSLPPSTLPPLAETTESLADVASTKAVVFVEKACPELALDETDVEMDTERCRLLRLESGSGTGCSSQGLPSRSPPTMQAAPCSPGTALPGFKNIKAMHVTSKEAPQSSSALEAMDLDMNGTPAMAPPSECEAGKSLPVEPPVVPSHVAQHMACSLGMVSSESENAESSQLLPLPAAVLPLVDAGTKTVTTKEVCHPLPVTGSTEEANGSILPPALENGCKGPLPHIEPHASSDAAHIAPTSQEITHTSFENSEPSQPTSPCLADTIDPSAHASATMPAILKSDKSSMPLSPLEPTDTDMESATLQQSPLKSEERSLPWPEQHPSSSSAKDATCSPEVAPPGYEKLDSSEQLPLPPPLSMKFELGQMVCGSCCQLLAYPRGAVHVQCFGCCTINLVLEEHQIGKVYCGQCDILLMYPFGAPAVKCSNCLFVTEIGERNVRPRISMEQSASPHPQDVAHQS